MTEQLFKQQTGISLDDYIKQFKYKNIFYIQRYKLKEEVDDTLQNYLIHLLRKINTFDITKSSLITFNYLLLDNFLKIQYRKENAVRTLRTTSIEVLPETFNIDVEEVIEEKLNLVYELLNSKIKELDKNIFLDRYLKQLTNEQLCEKYNLSQQQVKNRLHQTLKKVKQNI